MSIYRTPCESFLECAKFASESLDLEVAVTAAFLLISPAFICHVVLVSAVSGPARSYGSSDCFVILSALFTAPDSHRFSGILSPATTSQIVIILILTLLLLVNWETGSAFCSLHFPSLQKKFHKGR